jgi:hypothetical protein
MKYNDFRIWSLDQEYIDKITELYDIDYWDAEICYDYWLAANQIIDYILTEAVNNLDISDDNKDYLISKIYCNCIDSWYDISSNDVDDMIDWDDYEKQIIKDFLDL